jgi:hypothetical protein
MSKNELLLRETVQTIRALGDDELDAVSGGLNLENCMISGFAGVVMEDILVTSVFRARA